jgi:short-chain fatty acids transporter
MAARPSPVRSVTTLPTPEHGRWVDSFANLMERVVPDALTTAIMLMVVLAVLSLGVGGTIASTLDAYYRGLWSLLAFTMQMTLILVLSLILGATPFFKKTIIAVSRLPRTRVQVVSLAVLCGSIVAYLNWGLSIALSPIIGIHFAKEAERKGIPIDFLFLLATLAGAGAIWQFGFSGSAPLLMATPGHFLEKTTGVMPLTTTIWAPATIALVIAFPLVVVFVGTVFMPRSVRPVSQFVEASAAVETPADPLETSGAALSFAQRLERSRLVMLPLAFMLASWLYVHFFVKSLSLDINAVNTVVLFLGVVFHGTVHRYTKALREAVALCWPIVVLYHIYAGVAGLIQFTPVGDFLVNLFTPVLTYYSYTFLIVVTSTAVSFFIPTSGGQWLIQGLVTVRMAEMVGVSAQRGLLALSVGDHMGNLLTPFWAVVGASVARIDFRSYVGYRMIYAAIWFVMGVLAFTFLPA